MSTTQWEAKLTMPVTQARDHIQGPADAPVTLAPNFFRGSGRD